ncbi:hypothetical protein WEI85_15770 [Actinomycetes bacterium KLBMP 9797]
MWRDEEKLPLEELERAVATSAQDGQVDDVTGNDAGAEAAFGHGPDAADEDQDVAERAHRPSPTGRTGPH